MQPWCRMPSTSSARVEFFALNAVELNFLAKRITEASRLWVSLEALWRVHVWHFEFCFKLLLQGMLCRGRNGFCRWIARAKIHVKHESWRMQRKTSGVCTLTIVPQFLIGEKTVQHLQTFPQVSSPSSSHFPLPRVCSLKASRIQRVM